jgi:hypothetical protein
VLLSDAPSDDGVGARFGTGEARRAVDSDRGTEAEYDREGDAERGLAVLRLGDAMAVEGWFALARARVVVGGRACDEDENEGDVADETGLRWRPGWGPREDGQTGGRGFVVCVFPEANPDFERSAAKIRKGKAREARDRVGSQVRGRLL